MSTLVAGIDAGGTNVRLRWKDVETGGEEQLSCAADPEGGPEPAVALLKQLPGDVSRLVAGITKVTRGETKLRWEQALSRTCPSAQVTVVADFVVAFHGAVPEGVGVLCVAGTGSVIYGESGPTQGLRVGGRGWEFGDEGSGAFLTTDLLRRTLRACDGLWPHSELTLAVCAELGTNEAALLGEHARQRSLQEGRGFLAQRAWEQVRRGDREANELFVGAAGWLARFVRAAYQQLDFPEGEPVPVACVGGMWELAGEVMAPPFTQLLARWQLPLVMTPPLGTPVEGALRLAERNTL